MFRKSFFVLLLTIILSLGVAAASYADRGENNGQGKAKGHNIQWKVNKQSNWKAIQLTDIGSHWANDSIQFMCSQGIINGYPDLTFRPDVPVTKNEAIMMIAKASGFDGTFNSNRSWDNDVPQWMQECLDYSVDKGILTESEAENFKGSEPAKRYEVAVWAIRAMGLEQYQQVSFQDMSDIPVFARPYVGGMYRYHYMVGYPGNSFQPNKPVTRAELAAVLYRIMQDSQSDNTNGSDRVVNGVVDRVYSGSLVIDGRTYQITADTNIYLDNRSAGLNDINEGDSVTVYVDSNDRVTRLYARSTNNNYSDVRLDSLTPADGSSNVDTGTRELVARFNTEIRAVNDLQGVKDGIRVRNVTDGQNVAIDNVYINGRALTIRLYDSLENNKNYQVTIDAGKIEAVSSGRDFAGISGSQWEFSTTTGINIMQLTPQDGASNVDGVNTKVLRARFNEKIQAVSGKGLLDAVRVYNVSHSRNLDVNRVEIDQDTLVITLNDYLERGDTYEVTIRADYLEAAQDGENFAGISGSDWRFTTRY